MAEHIPSEEEYKEETLQTPGVLEKYQTAGQVFVLKKVIEKCQVNTPIVEICKYGNSLIDQELAKVYTKKKNLEKGIAFPVCISVNEICGNYSPLSNESDVLNAGDIAKIELGVHIDGFISQIAQTIIIGQDSADEKKANLIIGAYKALQAGLRLIKPGHTNTEVTNIISKIADIYGVNAVEGVLSHETKKHLIDGNKVIINKETIEQVVEEFEFQPNDIFSFEVMFSTGEGKPKESDKKVTVYKRALENNYILKTKTGRTFFNELSQKFPACCFSINSFEDEITAKMGVKESMDHNLVIPYHVLTEKQGELVAQFKITVCVLEGVTDVINELSFDESAFKTSKSIEDKEILSLLSTSMDKNEQRKAKKAAKKAEKENK